MEMSQHVDALIADLESMAASGGDAVAEAAERLATALKASAGLRILDALADAVLELSSQLPSGHVEVRLQGRDPAFVFVAEEAQPEEPAAETGDTARITLRLPEELKASLEAAAAREGASVNAWLVRAVRRALAGPPVRTSGGRGRLTGYGQS
jgi:HicB family